MNLKPSHLLPAFALAAAFVFAASSPGQTDGTPAAADPPAAGPCDCIATIDFSRIFLDCAQAKDLSELMRAREGEVQAEVRQRQKVIDEKQAALAAFRVGTPDYEAHRKELLRMSIDSNVWFKMFEQDMEVQKFEWTRVLYEQAQAAVAEISAERGLAFVLQTREYRPQEMNGDVAVLRRFIQDRAVGLARPGSDITNDVIARLDAKYQAAGGKKSLPPIAGVAAPAAGKP